MRSLVLCLLMLFPTVASAADDHPIPVFVEGTLGASAPGTHEVSFTSVNGDKVIAYNVVEAKLDGAPILLAQADTSKPLDAGLLDAGSAAVDPAPTVTVHAPDDLARSVYRGITSKDWFLVAGAALSLLVMGVRWLLAKKWPKVESEVYGIALVAVLAGLGGLSNAWLADERLASSVTLLGALKVWAAAVFAYVTTRKLIKAKPEVAKA